MGEKDFFISYTNADEKWAKWIAGVLEQNQYSTILQAWDFRCGEDFVAKMQEALTNAKRFLIIVSEKYLSSSSWTQREWTSALAKDPELKKNIFIPIYIEDVSHHKKLGIFGSIIGINLSNITEEDAKQELLSGVSETKPKRTSPCFPGKPQKAIPKNNFTFRQNKSFSGREAILKEMKNCFCSKHLAKHILVLTGSGGMGKSELSKQYAFLNYNDYDYIWWIDAEDENKIITSYKAFAYETFCISHDENNSNKIINSVKDWMGQNKKWLFIFDNIEADSDLERFLPSFNLSQKRNIIITTRCNDVLYSKGIPYTKFSIDTFTLKEAMSFLEKRTLLTADDFSEKLSEELDKIPQALESAAAYILVYNLSYESYLKLFTERRMDLLKSTTPSNSDNPIYITWDLSIKKLSPDALQLFNLCAFLAPDKINSNWFFKASEVLPEPLRSSIQDSLKRNEIKYYLQRHSLTKIEQIENDSFTISIHRLIQDIVRNKIKENSNNYNDIINICKSIMIYQTFEDFSSLNDKMHFENLYPHIDTVLSLDNDVYTDETFKLYLFMAQGSFSVAKYKSSLSYFLKSLDVAQKILNANSQTIASIHNQIGEAYINEEGQFDSAMQYFKEAESLAMSTCNNDKQLLFSIFNNIGRVHREIGRFDIALYYYEKAKNTISLYDSNNHFQLGRAYNNIGLTYIYKYIQQKETLCLEEALNNLLEAKRLLNEAEHSYTADVYNNIGEVYRQKGDLDTALIYQKTALKKRIKLYGEKHHETANSYNNIGNIYINKKLFTKALYYLQIARSIYKRQLGINHEYWAIANQNIAKIKMEEGNYEKAEELFKESLKVYDKVLDNNHPYTIRVRRCIEICHIKKCK